MCTCINNLTRKERSKEVIRIIENSIKLRHKTTRLIILSNSDTTAKISVNTVEYTIYKGINYICLCRIQNISPKIEIKLAFSFLTFFERLQTVNEFGEAFFLKGFGHKKDCTNWKLASLKTLCYFQIFLQGISDQKLSLMVKKGELPEILLKERPKRLNHLAFYSFEDLFQIKCSSIHQKIPSCNNTLPHLGIQMMFN